MFPPLKQKDEGAVFSIAEKKLTATLNKHGHQTLLHRSPPVP
jgi:hypothetical protein